MAKISKLHPFKDLCRRYEISLARCELDTSKSKSDAATDAACDRQDERDREIFAAVKSANPPVNKAEAVDLLTIVDLAIGDHHDEELVRPLVQKAILGLARLPEARP